jgi:hypothetical protein
MLDNTSMRNLIQRSENPNADAHIESGELEIIPRTPHNRRIIRLGDEAVLQMFFDIAKLSLDRS